MEPVSIFRAGSRLERRGAGKREGESLIGAQAPDQLLPLRAQVPGPPAVYLEKTGNTIPGGENDRG